MSDSIQNIKVRLTGEADLSNLHAAYGKLSQAQQDLVDKIKGVDTAHSKLNTSVQQGAVKTVEATEKTGKSFDDLKDKISGLTEKLPFAEQISSILGFAKAVGGVTTAVEGTTGAMKLLKIAIASTGIGALVVAIGSLYAYFTRTEEGAAKLKGAMAGVEAVVDVLMGALEPLGKLLVDAFNNPVEGIKKLGQLIVDNIVNRFKAIPILLEAVGKAFTGDFNKALQLTNDGMVQLTTGVTDASNKLKDLSGKAAEAAKQAYNISLAFKDLTDREREFSVESAVTQKRIAELIIQAKNRTITEEERLFLLQEAGAFETDNLNKTIALAKEKLGIIQRDNEEQRSAGKTNQEQRQREVDQINLITELETAAAELQDRLKDREDLAEQNRQQKELQRLKDSITKQENAVKEQYARRQINEEQLTDKLQVIQMNGYNREKALLKKYGLDVTDVNKSIEDARVKQRQDADKELQALNTLKEKDAKDSIVDGLNDVKAGQNQLVNDEKERYAQRRITKETFEDNIQQMAFNSLEKQRQFLIENGQDTTDIEKQLLDMRVKMASDAEDAETKKAEAAKQQRVQIRQQEVQLLTSLVNGFFQLQQQKYDHQLQALQVQQNKELQTLQRTNAIEVAQEEAKVNQLAAQQKLYQGQKLTLAQQQAQQQNALDTKQQQAQLASLQNSQQKQDELQQKYLNEQNKIKRKQAIAQKEEAAFNILINTAQAITKTLATIGLPAAAPLIALDAAIGAAQLAFVAAQPMPSYNKGTKGVPGYDTGQDSVMAMLRPGEGVMPVDRMKNYRPAFDAIFDKKIPADVINNLVLNYDKQLPSGVVMVNDNSNLEKHLKRIESGLSKLQVIQVNMDEKGFKKYITKENSRSQIMNNYLRTK